MDQTRNVAPRALRLVCLGLLLLASPGVAAEQREDLSDEVFAGTVDLGVESKTSFPLTVGGRIWLELPGRVRLGAALGSFAGPYREVVVSAAGSLGGLDAGTRELVLDSVDRALVVQGDLTWRVMPDFGAYFGVGYTLLHVSGTVQSARAVSLLGMDLDPRVASRLEPTYSLTGNLHLLTAEVGYMWELWQRLTVRLAAGAAFRVASGVDLGEVPGGALEQQVAAEVQQTLEQGLGRVTVTPTVTLAVGFKLWPWS